MPLERFDIEAELAKDVSTFYADFYGFVIWAFNWGEGDLEGFDGPDVWQKDEMDDISAQVKANRFDGMTPVDPIRQAISSGHGIGKSAFTAWTILWIMSTRPHAKGIVTANTSDQLRTKTWAELGKWRKRCLVGHWFEYNNGRGSMSLYHRDYGESWRVDGQTCREENSESFAGLHSISSSPFYIFDEACHDDKTEVLTDEGWLLFKDVNESHQLLTKNTDTSESYFSKPSHIHAADYAGDMMICESRSANYSVTPDHRMIFTSRKIPTISQFEKAGDMIWSNKQINRVISHAGENTRFHIVPEYSSHRKQYSHREVEMADWCEFLGWFITEGHTQHNKWKSGGSWKTSPATVTITQKQQNYLDEIVQCVDRMGFTHSVTSSGVNIYDPALCAYLDAFGKGFAGKRVPKHIKQLSPVLIDIFLDAAVKGDGYVKGNQHILYTSSELLAGDYQELILRTGMNSTTVKRKIKGQRKWILDHWATSSCDGYVVSRTFNHSQIDCASAKPTRQHYVGKVYCATVSGGVLLTRRNGKVMWSGNSAVPDKIWEVAEGGLTDGEPFIMVYGNPTRNKGRFKSCFTSMKHRWHTRQIDSRTVKITNKELIDKWEQDWGADSDFFRVRVRGVFPRASDMQLIPNDVVYDARTRRPVYMGDDALICGVDVARGGGDECVIQFRRGKDAKSEKVYKIPAEKSRDSMRVISMLTTVFNDHQPDVIFVDETGLGGPMVDRLRQLGWTVHGVNFGSKAIDEKHYANRVSEMWARMRNWLIEGGAINADPQLEEELTHREYQHDKRDRLMIESKDKLEVSPDWADALSLTFASSVAPIKRNERDALIGHRKRKSWDVEPLDAMD